MSKNKQKNTANQPPSLLKAIGGDLLVRHWFVSVLAVLFVSSSMMRAHTSHKVRRLTAEWQSLRHAHHQQQIAWEASRLELTTISEADRISNLARKQLGMIEVTTKNEVVLSL